MGYGYPIDVADLVARLKKRGQELIDHLGLADGDRDDLKLTKIVWGVGRGWFPTMADGSPHSGLDIGLPDVEGHDSYKDAPVVAIGDGTVVFTEAHMRSEEDYDQGRVLVQHKTPDGKDFYALYYQLNTVQALNGQKVKQGDLLGTVGWHGDFPHLHFACASLEKIGGDDDLTPEATYDSLPSGQAAWNVLRVAVEGLDENEWPSLSGGPWYLFNPVELVRFCLGQKYEHDVGKDSPHSVEPASAPVSGKLSPFGPSELVVDSIFQSKALSGVAPLEKLACDPDFAPVGAKYADAEIVKAVQRALATMYSLGKSGPHSDGIDGDFGNTTTKVVTKFQAKAKDMDLSAFGRAGADVPQGGKVDWLTLMALDAAAAAHEGAPAEVKKKKDEPPDSPAGPPPQRPKGEVIPPPKGSFVFDPAAGPSLKFGMLMYKALLNWLWDGKNGVGYSTCTEEHYDLLLKDPELNPEWPDMRPLGIEPDPAPRDKHGKHPVFSAFGCAWKGTNFTNCCNSQMAAMLVATGGRAFGRKGSDGQVTSYDLRTLGEPRVNAQYGGRNGSVPAIAVYEKLFASVYGSVKVDGKQLVNDDYGGMLNGMVFLDIGKPLCKFTSQAKDMSEMRVGDTAHYPGHAWLVGDVRYGIFFRDLPGRNNWHYVVDQSSFIDAEKPKLYKVGKGDGYNKSPSPSGIDGRDPMSAKDCDWVAQNEDEFQRRIKAFLGATSLEVDGTPHAVEAIEVTAIRCFSANGTRSTCHSVEYDPVMGPDPKKPEKQIPVAFNKSDKQIPKYCGITQPWAWGNKIAFGRYYGPAK
ncbi:MAG TPA: peptidoglycan DD-metalloendopeptidase family protein [Myxococcales bacterium]|nr:peptidoglycan DD-metalloendopeptidase family protein [Myxococcales bacterium]